MTHNKIALIRIPNNIKDLSQNIIHVPITTKFALDENDLQNK